LISESSSKNDRPDARMPARLARFDPELLHPIQHRNEATQGQLLEIRARAALLETFAVVRRRSDGGANRVRASRSCGLPRKQMCTCGRCWCKQGDSAVGEESGYSEG